MSHTFVVGVIQTVCPTRYSFISAQLSHFTLTLFVTMSKVITLQVCGIILDELYHNACKSSVDQVSMGDLCKRCKVSINTLASFKNILISRKLLLVDGKGRGMKYSWNPERSAMNYAMQKSIYDEYIGSEKRKVKLKVNTSPKKSSRVSLETALQVLVKNGFTGTIRRVTNHYTTECIDLSLIKVEE